MKIQTAQLGEVVTILGGGTPARDRPEYFDGNIPWATVKDLTGDFFISKTQEQISQLGLENSASRLIPPGNVLLGTRMSVGKAAINLTAVAINQDLKALFCAADLDPRYLAFFLAWAAPRLEAQATGATVKGITIDDIEALEIPLPSKSQQQLLVDQLLQADRLRRTRRYTLELTDSLLPAAFLQFFSGDGERFAPCPVDELAARKPDAIRTGPFGSQLLHSEFTDRGIAVLGIDNVVHNRFEWVERRFITPEKYQQLRRYTVFPGDVLITIMGTCGRCAIVPDDIPTAINTKHLCCITLDQERCLPVYLHAAFLHHPFAGHQLRVATKGAIMEGLNMEIIKTLRIPLPPVSLQQQFADLVERAERLRAVQRESLRQAESLFDTILACAFGTPDVAR